MVIGLLWVFFLAAAVTWWAAALATPVYVSNSFLRYGVRLFLGSMSVVGCGGLVFIAAYARYQGWIYSSDLALAIAITACFVFIAIVMLFFRFWRQVNSGETRQPIRRRTVVAFYILALMFVGMHLIAVQVAPGVVVGEIDVLIQPAQSRCEAWLAQEQIVRAADLAAHRPGDPDDAASAYIVFFEPDDPVLHERRKAFQYRMGAIGNALFLDRYELNHQVTLNGYMTLGTPEDDIAETPVQTLNRFAADLEALRTIAHLFPLYAEQSITRLRQRPKVFYSSEMSDYARWFRTSGTVALYRRQFDRAAIEMETMAALSRQTREVHGLLDRTLVLSVEFSRQNLAEQWLNTPDLTLEDLNCLKLNFGEIDINQQLRDLDFWEWQVLMDNSEAAGKCPVFFTPPAIHSGYFGWLGGIYLPRGSAQQYAVVANDLRGWLNDPLPWPAARWKSWTIQGNDGQSGNALRTLTVENFRYANLLAARWRMLQAGKAAIGYRIRNGNFPSTMAQLVPADLSAVPIDPFTGQPLQAKVEGEGMWIWSAGAENTQPDLGGTDWYYSDEILPLGAAYTHRETYLREQEEARRSP